MSLANTIYQSISDEAARLATITVDTGTPNTDPNYAPSALVDENPAKVAKIDSTTGSFLFSFAEKQPVALVALIHHCLDEGLLVRIQGGNDNGGSPDPWESPAFEAAITIPAWLGQGTRRWPVNPWLDLASATPLRGTFDPDGFQYWRLLFGDLGTSPTIENSQNVQLGQVWFGTQFRYLDPDLQWGDTRTESRALIENATSFGVRTIYGRGTVSWGQTGDVKPTDHLRDDLREHWHDVAGRERPFLWIPDGEINEAHLVRWATSDRQWQRNFLDFHLIHLDVEEVSRGLRPGT